MRANEVVDEWIALNDAIAKEVEEGIILYCEVIKELIGEEKITFSPKKLAAGLKRWNEDLETAGFPTAPSREDEQFLREVFEL